MKRLFWYVCDNGWAPLLPELARWAVTRVRSAFFRRVLHANGLLIGRNARISGARFLKIGIGFRAGDDLWIEAIRSPNEGASTPKVTLGDHISISRWVHIACTHRIDIGDSCLIGSKVLISDHNHGKYHGHRQSSPETRPNDRELDSAGPVIIGRNVWIGDNAVIIGPVEIGDGAIIAANAVVVKNVPDNTVAAGIPARSLKQYDPSSASWLKVGSVRNS